MAENHQHRRSKSSVLSNLSFIHKRTPSAGAALSRNLIHNFKAHPNLDATSCFFSDTPNPKALGEGYPNRHYQYSNQPISSEENPKTLGKKTLSAISLKSLSKNDAMKMSEQAELKSIRITKPRSSTNLGSLLSRPKSLANLKKEASERDVRMEKNKENAPLNKRSEILPTPIYIRYTNEHTPRKQYTGKFLEDEIDLYTPKNYSPGKQRDFLEIGNRPTLTKRNGTASRPKSAYLPSNFSLQDISRRVSGGSRNSAELIRRVSGRKSSYERKESLSKSKPEKTQRTTQKRSQRVLAAVSSSFSTKPIKAPEFQHEKLVEESDINKEFEAMLDRRNIPDHQRGKMRSLALSVKKDFIRQDWAEIAASKLTKLESNIDPYAHAATGTHDELELNAKRPRSRTFTLSRAAIKDLNIPSKKNKPEASFGKISRKKSSDSLVGGGRSFTAVSAAAAQNVIAKAKGQTPDDFVSYLRKITKPQLVEVGKLHKLRLLLRNETVAWTDDFIQQGGMEEILGLLHRTMAVEWREEHEDALLHEVLLCLKGLSTTALAMKFLDNTQSILFPALLHMLFDEERKGPSEFTTRNIITSLLFTYLKSAPISERSTRAKAILSYLRDPEPIESQKPVGFVLEMRRPRPYRVWCKEVVDVTKEVFWIFLHNLNVIPLPGSKHAGGDLYDIIIPVTTIIDSPKGINMSDPAHVYSEKYFPRERPPIAAAPYVGGVEWDATNYLASHLDLVNGILACIPSREERNQLREQMLVSGWEKCMGSTLRLCKEKFYSGVHAGLRCWVAAADEDGWDTKLVRCGPPTEAKKNTPMTSAKKEGPTAPKIALDFLDQNKIGVKAKSAGNWL